MDGEGDRLLSGMQQRVLLQVQTIKMGEKLNYTAENSSGVYTCANRVLGPYVYVYIHNIEARLIFDVSRCVCISVCLSFAVVFHPLSIL